MNLEMLRNLDKKYAQAIANYLLKRIETDECLKEKLETTEKSLKGCVEYCKAEARKQAEDGVAIIEDSQVYEWCVHYFLEDSLNNEHKAKPAAKKETVADVETDAEEETEKVDTLFGEEEVKKEKINKKEKVSKSKPKKDVKEDFKEQLTLFDF